MIVQVLTDNKNRAVSEIRHAFSKNGGNLGESGSVGYMFTKKGLIVVAKSAASEDKLTEIVLEAGADDLTDEGETLGDDNRSQRVRCGAGSASRRRRSSRSMRRSR